MSRFTYATICSGVECCSLALNAAPPTRGAWQPIFFSEIAPFQSALLAHYYPSVPNLGDMTKIDGKQYWGKCACHITLVTYRYYYRYTFYVFQNHIKNNTIF